MWFYSISLRCFAFLGRLFGFFTFSLLFYLSLIFCLYLILFSSPFLFLFFFSFLFFPLFLSYFFLLLPPLLSSSSSPHFLFPQQSNPIQSNPDRRRLNFGLFDLLPSHGYTLFWLGSTSPLTSILLPQHILYLHLYQNYLLIFSPFSPSSSSSSSFSSFSSSSSWLASSVPSMTGF